MKSALVPLFSYLTHRQAKPTGNTFVDSAKLQIYHNLSIPRHCRFG
ncbi:Mobile element protein [Candidatus Enterovibrio escicola]|uniref:Mobile element protein n=2 Tax=Candidatus Enterovibrio escicola TaxID=1927127 RepID=A0A2A5T611_9GAMM|nr:Mobile element protein [Candidatus Enterovibrio escacola]